MFPGVTSSANPKSLPATKQKLLDAAEPLMIQNGYVATTVDDICAAAEVTKGAFFYHFASKEVLARELLERFMCRQGEMLAGSCCGQGDPLDRVFALLDCVAQAVRQCDAAGCLVGAFAQELSESHPELRTLCNMGFQHTQKMMSEMLEAARVQHVPEAQIDIDGLAEQFVGQIQGAMLLVKASGDRGVMERSLGHYRRYLELLFRTGDEA